MALPAPVDGQAPGYFGVYPAVVTDIVDPLGQGRVQVRFPWLGTDGDRDVRVWATLCSPYADDGQGLEILPEVDSQVVVAFEAGDLRRPYALGACWNGTTALPHAADRSNNLRQLRSRAHSRLEFDDKAGAAKVTLTTEAGHEVVLDAGGQEIRVRHANGCIVKLTAAGTVEIQANSSVKVTAPMVTVDAATSTFNGNVICQSLIAQVGVVSPSYTPGVGNVW